MKKLYIFLLAACLCINAFAEPVVIKCNIKSKTTFAIITDSQTYSKCSKEINSYKETLESEGLGTYIVHSQWTNPDEVKAEILKLKDSKPMLEGIVLVGDIPVVMVREGQHLTTAFKMNEKTFAPIESSVASDRFYDDFDLKFDFIAQDEEDSRIFYYRLSENGAQRISSNIYSARMKVPDTMTGDKYEIMSAYLRKVVAAHNESDNTLDHFTFFAGTGYNSDCLTIWRQKPLAMRESFPFVFAHASNNRFLNFREDPQMKWNLFNEIQRKGTDVMQFSEHGDPDTQYISPSGIGRSLEENLDFIKRHEDPKSAESRLKDSLETANSNISEYEVMKLHSNARIVILNACYNGSFHNKDGYVAGCHVFGDGDCIVAQGNTVNVLQDKWEDKLIGLLSIGERVGMWQRGFTYLESHLIGDPTYRFASHNKQEKKVLAKLHMDLLAKEKGASSWSKYLKSDDALLRAVGVTYCGDSDMAYKTFCNDASWMVRIHALNALWTIADKNAYSAALKGLTDSYELIVRTSARMIGSLGLQGDVAKEAVTALENAYDAHPEMIRARFQMENAMDIYHDRYKSYVESIADKSLTESKRISAMRMFRNSRIESAADNLLKVICDASEPANLRKTACEVIGWYDTALYRQTIIEKLNNLADTESDDLPSELRNEIKKTVSRLGGK